MVADSALDSARGGAVRRKLLPVAARIFVFVTRNNPIAEKVRITADDFAREATKICVTGTPFNSIRTFSCKLKLEDTRNKHKNRTE